MKKRLILVVFQKISQRMDQKRGERVHWSCDHPLPHGRAVSVLVNKRKPMIHRGKFPGPPAQLNAYWLTGSVNQQKLSSMHHWLKKSSIDPSLPATQLKFLLLFEKITSRSTPTHWPSRELCVFISCQSNEHTNTRSALNGQWAES